MSKFWFILIFELLSIPAIVAQTTLDLLLPLQPEDVISINVNDIPFGVDTFSYDYLSIYVANKTNEYSTTNPVQGKLLIVGNYLTFKPILPFEIGLPYILQLKNTNSNEVASIPFQIGEKEKNDLAKVLNIFPSADLLPENLFRFYIYFQTPMRQEEALNHIKLIDAQGKIDDHAFMKFKEELWSNDGTRLTLLFDPGRIKRGVASNVLRGPSLENGNRYYLRISGDWKDVYGQRLSTSTKKEITIIKAYREKVIANKWILEKPTANSLDKLCIRFDRIIDHALIQSMITIRDGAKNLVKGYWEMVDQEKQIQFMPDQEWKKGNYKIEIDTRLEDVSGNNLQTLLDAPIRDQTIKDRFQFLDFKIL